MCFSSKKASPQKRRAVFTVLFQRARTSSHNRSKLSEKVMTMSVKVVEEEDLQPGGISEGGGTCRNTGRPPGVVDLFGVEPMHPIRVCGVVGEFKYRDYSDSVKF